MRWKLVKRNRLAHWRPSLEQARSHRQKAHFLLRPQMPLVNLPSALHFGRHVVRMINYPANDPRQILRVVGLEKEHVLLVKIIHDSLRPWYDQWLVEGEILENSRRKIKIREGRGPVGDDTQIGGRY